MNSNYDDEIDFWFYQIGCNIIRRNYRSKKGPDTWKQWQTESMPLKTYEEIKKSSPKANWGIVTGRLHRGPHKDKYLVVIDLDNTKAIKEFLFYFAQNFQYLNIRTLEDLGKATIVIQHEDAKKQKAHIYFILEAPIPKLSSIKVNIKSNVENADVPAIEVKSDGTTLIMVPPSVHNNGFPYRIIGTKNLLTFSNSEAKKLMDTINNICRKHGIVYPGRSNNSHIDNKDIRWMIRNLRIKSDTNFKIDEGARNNTLFSISRSIINCHGNKNEKNLDDLKKFFEEINLKFCYPMPLTQQETDDIWKSNLSYHQQGLSKESKSEESWRPNVYDEDHKKIEYATQRLLKKYHFITLEENRQIYYYDKGVYKKGGEIIIEKEVEEDLDYLIGNRHLTEIKGHIMRKTYHKKLDLDADLDIINVKNGLYSISKNKLNAHTPEYLSIVQKPIVFNSETKPKLLGKFLKDVLYHEEIRMAIEIITYTFYRDCPFEYFFKLFGYGANGKSVFTGLLTSLHGRENVSNVSIKSLLENRFAISDLDSKDINIDNELTYTSIKDTSTLKKLTGGRKQEIRMERKNQHAYDAYIYAKMFFNANSLNDVIEKTIADYRREVIISFPNTFEGKKDDPHLLYKLSTEEEMSGIFNVLMKALGRILQKNELYLNEKTIDGRRRKSDLAANPVKSFIDEAVSEESVESDYITKTDLYYAYVQFCKKNKIAAKTIELFGKNIKKLNFPESKITIEKHRKRVWLGINIKPQYLLPVEQLQLDFNQEKMSKLSRVS